MEGWDGWKRLRQVYSSTDNLKATPWLLPACLRVEQEDTNSTWDEQGCSCFSLSSHLSSCTRNTQGPPHALETIVAPTSTPLSLPVTICLPFPPTTTCKVHTPVQIPYKAEEPAGRLRYESHSYGNSTVYFGISKKKKNKSSFKLPLSLLLGPSLPTLLHTSAPNALARRHTHTDVCHQQTKCLKITSSPFALFCLWLKAIMLGQRGERSRGRGSPGAAEDSCDRATGPSLSSAFLLEVLVLSCINNGHLCWSEMLLIYFMLITASAWL